MRYLVTICVVLLATPATAASLLGSWNCQYSSGDAGLGRVVTYEADGSFNSRQAMQIKVRHRGKVGKAKAAISADGHFVVKGNILAERVERSHSPTVTVTTEGKATRLRGREAEAARRRISQPNHVRYVIRRLTETRMVMDYVSKQTSKASEMRLTCRRTNG